MAPPPTTARTTRRTFLKILNVRSGRRGGRRRVSSDPGGTCSFPTRRKIVDSPEGDPIPVANADMP